jgi:hypothetical protein
MSWASIQLGSREHYAVPLALQLAGRLDYLITDARLSSASAALVRLFHPSLAGQRYELLLDSKVRSATVGRLLTDLRLRQQRKSPWSTVFSCQKLRYEHNFKTWLV